MGYKHRKPTNATEIKTLSTRQVINDSPASENFETSSPSIVTNNNQKATYKAAKETAHFNKITFLSSPTGRLQSEKIRL